MKRSFSTNLSGKVKNFSLPYGQPLIPIFEAIVNSIHAIEEKKNIYPTFEGIIKIRLLRDQTLLSKSDNTTIDKVVVFDNGIGFNDQNMESFMTSDSTYKEQLGGRGVGRFSWLKVFENVAISSIYEDNGEFNKREFSFALNNTGIEDRVFDTEEKESETYITFYGIKKKYYDSFPKQLNTIASRIIEHCIIYLLDDNCPQIIISDEEQDIIINELFEKDYFQDSEMQEFFINKQKFQLLHIKIKGKQFVDKNNLYLCANNRLVEKKDLEKTISNLDKTIFEKLQCWYLGVLSSDYLDNNVDMNRISFTLPLDSKSLLEDVTMAEIINETSKNVKEYLFDYLLEVEDEKMSRFKEYAINNAPEYRHLFEYKQDKINELKPSLNEKQLDDELYKIKRDFENETNDAFNDLIKKKATNIISSDQYQKEFEETISRVTEMNKSALAKYITHRKTIIELFKHGIEIQDDGKFNLEKYIHELVYPMKSTSDEVNYDTHNLWMIDEKLSYSQYISSDKPFDNNPKGSRTDFFFLNNPVALADGGNDGTVFDSITIFELKRPMRDDYSDADNPIKQLYDYVENIRDNKAKDSKHRQIKVSENTKFYLYAICDITSSLKRIMDKLDFTETPDKLGAFSYNKTYNAYVEVLSYDKLINDSEKRNRVLFDKLGIK